MDQNKVNLVLNSKRKYAEILLENLNSHEEATKRYAELDRSIRSYTSNSFGFFTTPFVQEAINKEKIEIGTMAPSTKFMRSVAGKLAVDQENDIFKIEFIDGRRASRLSTKPKQSILDDFSNTPLSRKLSNISNPGKKTASYSRQISTLY